MEGIVIVGLFLILLLLRIPIAYALGMSTLVTILCFDSLNVQYLIQTMFTSCDSFSLLAVPFFIISGDVMVTTGISEKLISFIKALIGHRSGALSMITVICCMIFAAISGSGVATVAAIGGIMIPAMIRENYDAGYAAAISAAAGAMGPIIPPSITFVMYASTIQGISVSDLFTAGIIPGLMMGLVLLLYGNFMTKKHHWGVQTPKTSGKEKLAALKDASWALLMPVIILGGIYSGICTPTEPAVIACSYGLLVGFFVYKTLNLKSFYGIVKRSIISMGGCVIIMGFASAFGRILTLCQIPQSLATFVAGISSSKYVVLLIINLFLFVVGMLMESIAAVVIVSPILLPVVQMFGISPVHFGIIMATNLAVGLCTPPVGVNTFMACQISGMGMDKMIKQLLPCIGLLFLTVLVISFFPQLYMWMPALLK